MIQLTITLLRRTTIKVLAIIPCRLRQYRAQYSPWPRMEAGQFTKIADAVNAVPDNSTRLTIIKVKNGIYNEKVLVPSTKKMITMIGESREETVLVNGDSASTIGPNGQPLGTSNSYTLRTSELTLRWKI